MKITVSNFNFIKDPVNKNRIISEGGNDQSPGIKRYGKITGRFLSQFGKAIELKDSKNVWYVKKGDLQYWAELHGTKRGFALKQLNQVIKGLKENQKTEIEALMSVIVELKNNPNKTASEMKQLKEFEKKLTFKLEKKVNEIAKFIDKLDEKSLEDVQLVINDWLKKMEPFGLKPDNVGDLLEVIYSIVLDEADNCLPVLKFSLATATQEVVLKKLKSLGL